MGIYQTWLVHPTKWGYTNCLYMTKILHHPSHALWGVQITSYDQKRDSSKDYNRQRQIITSWVLIWPLHWMIYMTFIIESKYLNRTMIFISNYHTPCMICSISICQQHPDQQPIYVHVSVNIINLWQRMSAYRYQLILLISSRSTCFVSFHESTQHMSYLQVVTKSFTPYHMWEHHSHHMIFHIITKNCMIFPQGPSIYEPCIITREHPTSDKHQPW